MTAETETLTTALEQGIRYWADVRNVQWAYEGDWENVVSMEVKDAEGPNALWIEVDADKIHKAGYRILFGEVKVRRDIQEQFLGWPIYQNENPLDAEAADCAVQVAVFGDIIFG